MKKNRRERPAENTSAPPPAKKTFVWWPWALGVAALFAVFEAYGPSLNGPFVLDDLALMFANPRASGVPLAGWIGNIRPLLTISYWVNYQQGGPDPYWYHFTNVLLHFLGSVVITLVTLRLLELAGVVRARVPLAIFGGALFLLHPVQTESVAYVASRSEVLSVLFYMSAFAVFLYRRTDSMSVLRALAILALFGAAVSTKEHTLTLPVLIILADWFFERGGVRKNGILYGMLAAAALVGGWFVWGVLRSADTAGFSVRGMTPAAYFFTQGRVIWTYLRLFLLPIGQNADPDIALSNGPLDHGAILGWLAIVGLAAAAFVYRKRFRLAAFGVLMFLLLIAPTSTVVPIRDVLAERRLYLPFLGLILVTLEFLRRLTVPQIGAAGTAVSLICIVLTYQRSAVWGDPVSLWRDTVAKSPQKWRPRFQLAHEYYLQGQCPKAVENYEAASKLGPSDVTLLVDWALALDCMGLSDQGIAKLREAAKVEHSAHVMSQIGMMYGKQRKMPEALEALDEAEKLDPRFEMTYVYRGNVYEVSGDRAKAAEEYRKALLLNPANGTAQQALARTTQ